MATGNEPSSSTAIDGELLEKAMRELNENPDTREQAISDLRNAITSLENDQQYQGVVFERRDSPFLLRFLRARKFDQERALSLYAHYYSNKRDYPEIFKDLNVRNVADVLSSGAVCSLDSRMNDGSNVICIHPARWDMDRYQPGYVLRTVILIMEKLLENEETQIHGVSIFHYMQDLEFTTLWRFSQSEVVQKGTFFSILQDGMPIRLKGIHLIHQPWYISILLTIARPFMKEKLRQRLVLHGEDLTNLYQLVDVGQLPSELGGPLPSLDQFKADKLFADELLESVPSSSEEQSSWDITTNEEIN